MIDPRQQELIHEDIDNELKERDREALRQLLAESEEARRYHAELSRLNDCLDRVPEVEPPESLHERILADLPAGTAQVTPPSRGWNGLAGWFRYGFAAAAGLVLAVAIYEGRDDLRGPVDVSQMAGTLVSQGAQGGQLVDTLSLSAPGLEASASLRRDGEALVLSLDSRVDGAWQFDIDLADSGLAVDAVVSPPDQMAYHAGGPDSGLEGSLEGAQQVIVLLRTQDD